jgi:hypothetical protein
MTDPEQPVMWETDEIMLQKLSICRNQEIKYETQMYNWYPIFNALSLLGDFRQELNNRCYQTIRLLE